MAASPVWTTHEAYLAAASPAAQPLLAQIQRVVETSVPDATRCISYNLPAYRQRKVFFYFAAFKAHIGIYPPVHNDRQLVADLAAHRNAKGNLRFGLDAPLPLELIARLARSLASQYD